MKNMVVSMILLMASLSASAFEVEVCTKLAGGRVNHVLFCANDQEAFMYNSANDSINRYTVAAPKVVRGSSTFFSLNAHIGPNEVEIRETASGTEMYIDKYLDSSSSECPSFILTGQCGSLGAPIPR